MKKSRPPIVWLGLSILPLLAFFAITVFVTLNTMYSFAFIVTLYEIAQRRAASGEAAVAVFGAAVSDGVAVAFLTNGVAAAAVFGLWYFLLCRPGAEAEGDGSKRCAPMVAWSIVSGLVLCTFATEMITVAEFFAPKVIAEFAEMMERTFDGSWLPILAAVLIAPFSEEFLCRGVTQHYLTKFTQRFWLVNTLQALMFGIMHWNLVQGVYAFFLGLALGYLRFCYRNMLAPIIVHFVYNLSTMTWTDDLLGRLPHRLAVHSGALALSAAVVLGIMWLIGRGTVGAATCRPREDSADNNGA